MIPRVEALGPRYIVYNVPAAKDKFEEAVMACVEDVNALVPPLAVRYSDLVVATALAEHVGAALRICIGNGTCTPEQAQQLLDHMDVTAFRDATR